MRPLTQMPNKLSPRRSLAAPAPAWLYIATGLIASVAVGCGSATPPQVIGAPSRLDAGGSNGAAGGDASDAGGSSTSGSGNDAAGSSGDGAGSGGDAARSAGGATGGGGSLNGGAGTGASGSGGSGALGNGGAGGDAAGTSGGDAGGGGAGLAGSGGTDASAGAGGATLPATCEPASAAPNVYDGMPSNGSCPSAIAAPRVGFWYSFNDGTGVQRPAPDEEHLGTLGGRAGAADCAMHNTGTSFTTWGGGFGFDFGDAATGPCTYDASAFHGISLYLKGTTAGTQGIGLGAFPNTVRVNLATTESNASDQDHYGAWCSVSGSYTLCSLSFATVKQAGWGVPITFNPAHVVSLAVQASLAEGFASTSWDVWVDDVTFF
ncbi:MAG TPA: hypothetical protein VGM29_05345 [Polyangiaceae bacterium]